MAAAAAGAVTLSPSIFRRQSPSVFFIHPFKLKFRTCAFRLRASPPRRSPNFSQEGEKNWNRNRITFYDEDDDEEEDDEEDEEDEDEEDRSLDLLIRFVENVFKKISKRARKSVRSVLPLNIPTKLVGFSVNGVIILAFFWILKAFLQVVCTLGSVVFVSILLVRGVWTGISYFQQGNNNHPWNATQPLP